MELTYKKLDEHAGTITISHGPLRFSLRIKPEKASAFFSEILAQERMIQNKLEELCGLVTPLESRIE